MKKYLYFSKSDFIIRTPLFSFDNKDININDFKLLSNKKRFKEAIYLASPNLYNELVKWQNDEIKDEKEIDRLTISLYKYFSRMQTRCTPFGLFAACGVGKWGNASTILLSDNLIRHTRLDMNYLCDFVQFINSDKDIMPLLHFHPNNSIYKIADKLRYVEYKYINSRRIHQICSVDNSYYLQKIIENSYEGASLDELSKLIVNEEVCYEDAQEFVKELIQNQLLVSALEPSITGDDFIFQIIHILKSINLNNKTVKINALIDLLDDVQKDISLLDKQFGNDIISYRKIFSKLKSVTNNIDEKYLYHTDIYRTETESTLNINIQEQLLEAVDFINKLSANQVNSNLEKFKEQFYKRYEEEEVALLEVLDTETGIGYMGKDSNGINSLLENLYVVEKMDTQNSINWDKSQDFLHKKLLNAVKNNDYEVKFSDEDLILDNNFTDKVPDTLSVMFRITGDRLLLHGCGGSSATNLLGRFAHGNKSIHKIANNIADYESMLNSDKIVAEIVHLPESRTGNILLRPIFRGYEIPYLGKSAIKRNNQILLNDLYVSIRNNKILLKSKKLNKEIAPRLSCAHNYSTNALPVYQFLCDLQNQDYYKIAFNFNWDNLSSLHKFLPRAVYKKVVLAKAKWQFDQNDFSILFSSDIEVSKKNVREWQYLWSIPQYILLIDGDNELLVNLNNELNMKMFLSVIKNQQKIVIEEFLFDVNDFLVKDASGNGYTNEFIAIFYRHEKDEITLGRSEHFDKKINNFNIPERIFCMGSEWLYYKFYCGIVTSDKILSKIVSPLIEELLQNSLIDSFFFIRYSDPESHIRLRLHITDIGNIGKIILLVNKYTESSVNDGIISKICTDTYKRELERYGFNSIEMSESLFYIDSKSILSLLNFTTATDGDLIRWQYAVASVNDLLDLFNFSLEGKIDIMNSLKNSFFEEHGGNKELKVQLDNKFRSLRKDIESVLDEKAGNDFILRNLLIYKKKEMVPIIEKIIQLNNNNQLLVPVNKLLTSYIHMMLNRIFNARQRVCELVIYDLLYKYYKSKLARNKVKI